jgi:hypothetical protein
MLQTYWLLAFSVDGTDQAHNVTIKTPPIPKNIGVRTYTTLQRYYESDDQANVDGYIEGFVQNGTPHTVHISALATGSGVTEVTAGAHAYNAFATYLFITDIFQ